MNGAVSGSLLLYPLHVPLWIDLAAVVVGALAGAAIAAREELDVFGALLLAVVMGLGGGIVRDLLLGLRPVAVTSPYYLPTVAVAALAGASVYVTADALHVDIGLSQTVAFLAVVAMRLSSLRWDLQTPFPPDVAQRLNSLRRRGGGPGSGSGVDPLLDDPGEEQPPTA